MSKQFIVDGVVSDEFRNDIDAAVKAAVGVRKSKDNLDKATETFRGTLATLAEEWGLDAADIHSGHGKGNVEGAAYATLFDVAARIVLTEKQYALATDESPRFKTVAGKRRYLPKHGLLNKVGNVVLDVRKGLEPEVKSDATEWEKIHSRLSTVVSGLKKANEAATDKAAERKANLGGAKQVKQALAAFDTLIAALPKK